MKLIIVESPTKAKTLKKFLGRAYEVVASNGHIRDLPKSRLGIDIENNFEPQYVIPTKARKTVNQLKKEAEKAEKIILATDADREGEAIAWHLIQALGLETRFKTTNTSKFRHPKALEKDTSEFGDSDKFVVSDRIQRIVFHEITKSAIEEALKNPRGIDMNLVNAQQARRILDRLVGYKLSPFLWQKVMKRLSAGRVQSVALRLIVEREEEIRKFKPEEYWSIVVTLSKIKNQKSEVKNIEAILSKINNETIPKLGIKTKNEAEKIVDDLKKCQFKILKIEKKKIFRQPPPPFITSSLQQEASKRLRFSVKQTMRLAQNLYENGLITYMRTDSLNLNKEFVLAAKEWLKNFFGELYVAEAPRFFKTKSKLAQEAHEAIRPTDLNIKAEEINASSQEKKLYELIRNRFLASQMPRAIFEATSLKIEAQSKTQKYFLNASGMVLVFDGFLKIWPINYEEKILPEVKENEVLKLQKIEKEQHFTEPPARYNEASLIKVLEEKGIGRPSTYAPIISVLQERNYVFKNEAYRFEPTEIGEAVNKILVENFPEIIDVSFTAQMEDELDEIAKGQIFWQKVIEQFYKPFSKKLEEKYQTVKEQKPIFEETNETCKICGAKMVVRFGPHGKFLACSAFPKCRYTKSLNDKKNQSFGICPKCLKGEIVKRRTKKGKIFYGCSRYPQCDYASWQKPS